MKIKWWFEESNKYLAIFTSFLLGFSDACFNTQVLGQPDLLVLLSNKMTRYPLNFFVWFLTINPITDVSPFKSVFIYTFYMFNPLTDVSPLTAVFIYTYCMFNPLTEVSPLTEVFIYTYCMFNPLTNVSPLTVVFIYIYCMFNPLTDFSLLTAVFIYSYCMFNPLTDVSPLTAVFIYTYCMFNPLMDFSPLTEVFIFTNCIGITNRPIFFFTSRYFPCSAGHSRKTLPLPFPSSSSCSPLRRRWPSGTRLCSLFTGSSSSPSSSMCSGLSASARSSGEDQGWQIVMRPRPTW